MDLSNSVPKPNTTAVLDPKLPNAPISLDFQRLISAHVAELLTGSATDTATTGTGLPDADGKDLPVTDMKDVADAVLPELFSALPNLGALPVLGNIPKHVETLHGKGARGADAFSPATPSGSAPVLSAEIAAAVIKSVAGAETFSAQAFEQTEIPQSFPAPENTRSPDRVTAVPHLPTITTQHRDAAHDVRALVDDLALAREMMRPRTGSLTVQHDEFGTVSLRFEARRQELSVSITGEDPALQRAVAAATPPDSRFGPSEHKESGSGQTIPQGHMRQSPDNGSQRRESPRAGVGAFRRSDAAQSSEDRADNGSRNAALYA